MVWCPGLDILWSLSPEVEASGHSIWPNVLVEGNGTVKYLACSSVDVHHQHSVAPLGAPSSVKEFRVMLAMLPHQYQLLWR